MWTGLCYHIYGTFFLERNLIMITTIFSKVQIDMGQFYGRVSARVLLNVPQRGLSYQVSGEKQELKNSIRLVWDETEMQSLLPFPRTELFEPYRDCEDMHDEVGYLKESWRMFIGISDSYVPMVYLRTDVIYDFAHRWPMELLYGQIARVIKARNDKRFRKIAS